MPHTYSAIVVDDDLIERDHILLQLAKFSEINVLADFESSVTALSYLKKHQVDLVFSDIEMPDFSGIELAKSLKKKPEFIFITSHSHFAIDGFEVNALDFVLKPITFERLHKAVEKAISYLELKNSNEPLLENVDAAPDHFFIKETAGKTKLYYKDVVYLESFGDFCNIYTLTGKHLVLVNLKNIETQMPSFFKRVHKQVLININHLKTISTTQLILTGDHHVPVSLTARQDLMKITEQHTLQRSKKD